LILIKPVVRPAVVLDAFRSTRLNRSALPITDTDERLIAAAANMGDSKVPVSGYKTLAATGTPTAL